MKGRLTAAAICMLMAMTGPAMAWQAADSMPEPNTGFDADNNYMWGDARGDHDDPKIYFDSIVMEGNWPVNVRHTANPDGGRMMPAGWYYVVAVLGFWVDCNGDDYMGNALTGQSAYSSVLLPNEDKCPAGSPYNDGDTVDEFRAIYRATVSADEDPEDCEPTDPREPDYDLILQCDGLSPYDETRDPYDIFDSEAYVWGDWSTPEKDAVPRQGIMPLPPGTLTSYHGHFKYVDDATLGDLSATVDGLAGDGTYYGIADALPDTYLGPYEDPGRNVDDSDSPVAYARYGYNSSTTQEGGEANCGGQDNPCDGAYAQPMVTVFDCSADNDDAVYAPTSVSLGDFGADPETGEVTANPDPSVEDEYWFPPVNPQVNPFGSATGTLNQNWRGFVANESDGCRGSAGIGLYDDNLESPRQDSSLDTDKVMADFILGPVIEWRVRGNPDYGLPDNIPYPDSGYCDEANCNGAAGGYWSDGTIWSRRPPRAYWGVTETIETTLYADVSIESANAAGTTLGAALPDGDNAAQYGAEACQPIGPTGTSSNGWGCDPADWNPDQTGNAPIIGDFYDLRDQDCYDGSLFGSPMFPTDRPCAAE